MVGRLRAGRHRTGTRRGRRGRRRSRPATTRAAWPALCPCRRAMGARSRARQRRGPARKARRGGKFVSQVGAISERGRLGRTSGAARWRVGVGLATRSSSAAVVRANASWFSVRSLASDVGTTSSSPTTLLLPLGSARSLRWAGVVTGGVLRSADASDCERPTATRRLGVTVPSLCAGAGCEEDSASFRLVLDDSAPPALDGEGWDADRPSRRGVVVPDDDDGGDGATDSWLARTRMRALGKDGERGADGGGAVGRWARNDDEPPSSVCELGMTSSCAPSTPAVGRGGAGRSGLAVGRASSERMTDVSSLSVSRRGAAVGGCGRRCAGAVRDGEAPRLGRPLFGGRRAEPTACETSSSIAPP